MTLPLDDDGLVDRLLKRAEEDARCAENNEVVADALSDQMERFEARSGHNTYAVRLALDHRKSAERDRKYEADLRRAAEILSAIRNLEAKDV